MVSGGRVVHEVSSGDMDIGVKGSQSLGEEAVEQSNRASFDTPVPSDGRSWKRLWEGW